MKRLLAFLIAVVVFALICPGNLWAKRQKPGAQLRITKPDGRVIEGELLAVKQDSLLLMTLPSNTGVKIGFNEIEKIGIKRKSVDGRFWNGAFTGAVIFGALGFGLGYYASKIEDYGNPAGDGIRLGYNSALLGGSLFGLLEATRENYKTIRVKGKSPSQIEKLFKKLKKRARFEKGLPADTGYVLVPPKPVSAKIKRIHFTVDHGYFRSQALGDYTSIFRNVNLGDDESLSGPAVWQPTDRFVYLKNFRIEYSISNKIALGFTFSPLKKLRVEGHISTEFEDENYGGALLGEFKGSASYLTASYMPLTGTLYKKSSFKIGAGIGLSTLNLDYRTNNQGFYGYPEIEFARVNFSKRSLSFVVFGEYDYHFKKHFSIGINIEYKYIPVRVEPFQIYASYGYLYNGEYVRVRSSVINFPEHSVNFGTMGIGLNLGIHF